MKFFSGFDMTRIFINGDENIMTRLWERIDPLDQKILLQIQSIRSPLLNLIFKGITHSATGPAWWSTAILLNVLNFNSINFVSQQTSVLRAFYGPLLTWVLGTFLQKRIARLRPSEEIAGYKRLLIPPSRYSFPSIHTASSFSFFIAFLLIQHPLAPMVGIWACFVSFSRLYLGVHYLSDIIGGLILGLFCTFVLSLIGFL